MSEKIEEQVKKIDISVVIPVYGCRAAIPELHRRLCESLEKISKAFEIILVDDYCPQNSWEEIQKVCEKDKRVIGIHMARNFGQIRAITAGLDKSRGDWVVVMDCDLQDRPETIPELYQKAQEGYDVVLHEEKEEKIVQLQNFYLNVFIRYMIILQTELLTVQFVILVFQKEK